MEFLQERFIIENHLRSLGLTMKDFGPSANIGINDQWRICFTWRSGDAFDVEIVDYHWISPRGVRQAFARPSERWMSRNQLQSALGLTHREHFTDAYLKPALDCGLIETTIPDKPRSSRQRYRLTALERTWIKAHGRGDE